MTRFRKLAAAILIAVFAAVLLADFLAPADYATQFRDEPEARPSRKHPLGTDELGRDRLSRLLHGTRVSLLLAPAAALLSVLIAALIGAAAGYVGGRAEGLAMGATDLFLSLPWLFLLLTVRALLPLNVSPWVSVVITFALLGSLGWAASARVVCAGARAIRNSDFILQARACGCPSVRLFLRQVCPNMKSILVAQFWISIPVFILAEANLGLLGLGVTEPLPSWGGLLAELKNYPAALDNPGLLAPLALLVTVVACFQLVLAPEAARQ
jgi:ABC-type dipeptide/oligopeptide/nickel transport system permease subunit